jgi:hypothetical protein
MDIMFVWGIPFLTTIDKTIRFRCAVPLSSQKAKEVYKALDVILRQYNDAGFFFKFIHCDREFRSLMEDVADDLNVTMNYAATGEHVPEAERNNRTIKDRVRTMYHQLPYKRIPKIMIKRMVLRATKMLNLLPAKGGISSYLSPYTIVTRRVVDYDRELATSFGAYVQANQDNTPTNTNLPRTLDCLFMGPTSGKQLGFELLNLATGQIIVRPKIRELPVTDMIIDAVEQLADRDGIKTMKFSTVDGMPFEDPAWIAGVDENENSDDSEGEDDEDDGDDDESVPSLASRLYESDSDTDSECSDPEEDPDLDNDDEDEVIFMHDTDQGNNDLVHEPNIGDFEMADDPGPEAFDDPNPTEVNQQPMAQETQSNHPEL